MSESLPLMKGDLVAETLTRVSRVGVVIRQDNDKLWVRWFDPQDAPIEEVDLRKVDLIQRNAVTVND